MPRGRLVLDLLVITRRPPERVGDRDHVVQATHGSLVESRQQVEQTCWQGTLDYPFRHLSANGDQREPKLRQQAGDVED